MNKQEIEKIVAAATKECEKNFNKHKMTGYTLANLTVIPFISKELGTRKVSDWGTDEDRDEYIWYSEEGWQHAEMVVQVGAGVSKVVKRSIVTIEQQKVVEILLECNLFEQIEFIHQAYAVLAISEFKNELY